jgi:hypothetical protein
VGLFSIRQTDIKNIVVEIGGRDLLTPQENLGIRAAPNNQRPIYQIINFKLDEIARTIRILPVRQPLDRSGPLLFRSAALTDSDARWISTMKIFAMLFKMKDSY